MSKKRNSKTGSKIERYAVKAQIKLTNTKETEEPKEIIDAKARLKATKKFTTSLETIVNNLYNAQNDESRLLTQLSDRMASINILNSDDKFSIFVNNMGRVTLNTQEIQQMYLINMKDQLMKPINEFNENAIGKCQALKLKLKAKKGQYDMKKKNEDKIMKEQQLKNVNLQKVHLARSKSALKLDDLGKIRNDFIASVNDLEKEKITLVNGFQQYMDSYGASAEIYAQNLKVQDKMHLEPPNINNKFGLDSDTEDINDHDETMSTFTDWGKTSIVVREGWVKKRGKVNKSYKKRWFKLFVNKKLIYLASDKTNAKMKGHINLNKIIGLNKKGDKYIDINTKTRLWALQFETIMDRDGWHNAIMETKGTSMRQTVIDFGNTFVDNYYNKNSYKPPSTPIAMGDDTGMPPPPAYGNVSQLTQDNIAKNQAQQENLDETNPFFEEEDIEGKDEEEEKNETETQVMVNSMPPPPVYDDEEDTMEETNPFFDADDDIELETVEQTQQQIEPKPTQDAPQFEIEKQDYNVGTQMKFVIVVEAVGLYEDVELTSEVFSTQLNKGEVVEGEYVNKKVVLLSQNKLYVAAMDVATVTNSQDLEVTDNFV